MRTPDRPEGLTDRDEAILATVDRALAGEAARDADPELRQIETLALGLREAAEAPRPEFVAGLDRRIAEGFPRSGPLARAAGRGGSPAPPAPTRGEGPPRRRWAFAPALAGAASIMIALLVALPALLPRNEAPTAILGTDRPGVSGDTRSSGSAVRTRPEPSSLSPRTGSPAEPSVAGEVAPDRPQRLIERSASLSLAVREERLEAVADAVVRSVDRRRGFVLSSSVATGEGAEGGGSLDLRVPEAALEPTLRELSALGQVRGRSQSGQDVTAFAATTEDRLDGARAVRRALLRRLETADSAGAISALRRRLDLASAEVRGRQGELRRVRERTDYASISVSLSADTSSGASSGPIADGWSDLLRILAEAVALGLRALGVLIPLGVLAVPAWFGVRALRRRRREAALG